MRRQRKFFNHLVGTSLVPLPKNQTVLASLLLDLRKAFFSTSHYIFAQSRRECCRIGRKTRPRSATPLNRRIARQKNGCDGGYMVCISPFGVAGRCFIAGFPLPPDFCAAPRLPDDRLVDPLQPGEAIRRFGRCHQRTRHLRWPETGAENRTPGVGLWAKCIRHDSTSSLMARNMRRLRACERR